jgi:hypothetical protein
MPAYAETKRALVAIKPKAANTAMMNDRAERENWEKTLTLRILFTECRQLPYRAGAQAAPTKLQKNLSVIHYAKMDKDSLGPCPLGRYIRDRIGNTPVKIRILTCFHHCSQRLTIIHSKRQGFTNPLLDGKEMVELAPLGSVVPC